MDPASVPPPKNDQVEPSEMVLQILSSLRNLDGSIDILLEIVADGICKEEFRSELEARTERLLDTRRCLTSSLMEIRPSLAKALEVDERSIIASEQGFYDAIRRRE